jgi:hypothetical protein
VTSSGVSFVSVRAAGISWIAGKTPSEEQPDSNTVAENATKPASVKLAMRRLRVTLIPVGPTQIPLRLQAAPPIGSQGEPHHHRSCACYDVRQSPAEWFT